MKEEANALNWDSLALFEFLFLNIIKINLFFLARKTVSIYADLDRIKHFCDGEDDNEARSYSSNRDK